MRRDEIVRSSRRILDDLRASGIPEMVENAFARVDGRSENQRPERTVFVSLEVFQKYAIAYSNYSENELFITRLLGIEKVADAGFWQKMLEEPKHEDFAEARDAVNDAVRFLPRFISIIEQEDLEALRAHDVSLHAILSDKELLKVILPEDAGQFSSATRLLAIIQSIISMYEIFAKIDDARCDDLLILSCDSGSDKSLDFAGLGKFIEQIRLMIMGIWDRRVYYRNVPASQSIGLIAQSLPVLEGISSLKEKGAISDSEAEILRRKAIESATKFMESGAILEDMDRESRLSPRLIMQPEQKLISGPPANLSSQAPTIEAEATPDAPRSDLTAISPEELRLLRQMIGRATKKPSTAPRKPQRKKTRPKPPAS